MSLQWILEKKLEKLKHRHFPFLWRKVVYRRDTGKKLNLKNPRDINEKIHWLMSYGDTSQWPLLADKYRVRQWVADRIGEEYLVPLLGKWDRAEDIDFGSLPDKFVMKPNNGSYDCVICSDKSRLDFDNVRRDMAYAMKHSHSEKYGEQHYKRIKPCIIAEQMLEPKAPEGLVDYKIRCFDGKPYGVFVCMNRNPITRHADYLWYDLDWNQQKFFLKSKYHTNSECPRPQGFEKMLEIASILSKGLPQARVDLYNVDGKIYFGEITMTSFYGIIAPCTQESLNTLGEQCVLPVPTLRQRLVSFAHRWIPEF